MSHVISFWLKPPAQNCGARLKQGVFYHDVFELQAFKKMCMILSEDHSNATYQIQSVSANSITVNNKAYTHSLIISPDKIIPDWKPISVDTLTDDDLLLLLALKPEIILLGTGKHSIILPAKKSACLLKQQFHMECMSTAAACRTYTILISEGRKVVAGLII